MRALRTSLGIVVVLSLGQLGCAAAFRSSKDTITVDSTPVGADITAGETSVGVTPKQLQVERKRSTELTLTKPGYETRRIIPRRHFNAGWITLDVLTCAIPVALCIPLLVDAVTGAWYDVDNFHASMTPGTSTPVAGAPAQTATAPASTGAAAPVSGPPPEMSESERKATARAAYLEGVRLQESGGCPEAIRRFETAERFFSAATHLLHLAQCQAATGKLVEAAETYETLVRTPLTTDSEAFRQAQEDGKKELASLRPRIPTLRIQVVPAPSSLSNVVVKLNNQAVPSELLGLTRPVNPGHYKVTVWAAGYKEASGEVVVDEGKPRSLDLKLAK